MTKQEVSEFFRRKGYSADRFGHFVVKKHGKLRVEGEGMEAKLVGVVA